MRARDHWHCAVDRETVMLNHDDAIPIEARDVGLHSALVLVNWEWPQHIMISRHIADHYDIISAGVYMNDSGVAFAFQNASAWYSRDFDNGKVIGYTLVDGRIDWYALPPQISNFRQDNH